MNRVVVVSNRVPAANATQAGGLAVAVDGLLRKRGGIWFGWNGEITDTPGPAKSERRGTIEYVTMALTREEHDRYYSNFSNSLLWPLLHSMPELMLIDRRDAQTYRETNARFARVLVPLLRPDDLIWVHDYHLLPLPAMLRARGVRCPIGFFLHIPFPTVDVLDQASDAAAMVRDVLAADLIGFQTDRDLENFCDAAQQIAGAIPMGDGWLLVNGRRVRLGVFPVEIDAREFASQAAAADDGLASERLRRIMGGQRLILGVDRLDPTKGLLQRLAAFRRLLETRPAMHRHIGFLQIAAASRTDVAAYRDLRNALDREAGAIISEYGDPDWSPIRLIARAGARTQMAGYMRAASVGLVTPLRDGMNLVAKEYVAAQDPQNPGVLVLSQFAGAARQLDAAILVNPYDIDTMADAMERALAMPAGEREDRWKSLWQVIADKTPVEWGRGFLAALLRAAARPVPRATGTGMLLGAETEQG